MILLIIAKIPTPIMIDQMSWGKKEGSLSFPKYQFIFLSTGWRAITDWEIRCSMSCTDVMGRWMCMSCIQPLALEKKIDNGNENVSEPLFALLYFIWGFLHVSPFPCRILYTHLAFSVFVKDFSDFPYIDAIHLFS